MADAAAMGRKPELAVGLLLAACMALARFLSLSRLPVDSDTWWHLKTGQWVLEHGIPRTDPFSWYGIEKGLHWVSSEWLFDVAAALTYRAGGFPALNAAAALLAGTALWLLYRLLLRRSGSWGFTATVCLLALAGTPASFMVRPQALSLVLLLAVANLLDDGHHWTWCLPLVLIGTNAHSGLWPMYLLVACYYATRKSPWLVPATFLASMAGPYGWEATALPLRTMGNQAFLVLQEWQPTTLNLASLPWTVTMALVLGMVATARVSWKDLLSVGALLVLAMSSIRHFVFVYVLVLPILAPYAGESWGRVSSAIDSTAERWGLGGAPDGHGLRRAHQAAVALVVLGSLALPLSAAREVPPPSAREMVRSEASRSWLAAHRGELGRMLNKYNDGGWMVFHDLRPMIDGRADVFSEVDNPGETLFEDYCTIDAGPRDPLAFLRKYRIDTVVLSPTLPLARSLRLFGFPVLHENGDMVVFRVPEESVGAGAPSP